MTKKMPASLLGMDEAVELVDKNDKEVMSQEQKKAEAKQVSMEEFKQEFQLAKQRCASAPKKGQKVDSSKPKVPHIMDQPTAKLWIPLTTSIWISTTTPHWWGHCPPYRRVVCRYSSAEDEPEAIQKTIRLLWKQYLERECKMIEDCPYAIF